MLDKNAIVFTRIWCGFEQATVVQGKKLLLDFVTVHEGKAQLLTEGVAASDGLGPSDWGRKVAKFDIFLSWLRKTARRLGRHTCSHLGTTFTIFP